MTSFHILSTGSELSSGRSRDANGPYLAGRLEEEGFVCEGISVIPDNPSVIKEHLRFLLGSKNIKFIIITGGLGPTADDLTVDILSEITGKNIIEEREHLKRLENLIEKKLRRLNLDIARRQVRILEGSQCLPNETGFAPGIFTESGTGTGKYIAALPGYPQEMNPMFENHLLKILKGTISQTEYFRRDFYLYGTSETRFQTHFMEKLNMPPGFSWGVASRNGHLKVFFISENQNDVETAFHAAKEKYKEEFLEKPAVEMIHRICTSKNITIGGAESCTGGLIGKLLTDLPGSSAYFKGCIVSYANEIKISQLNVHSSTLEKHGAVSRECAAEMAEGAQKALKTDFSFAVTGVAGPGGGTEEKPVGTVWIALRGNRTETKKLYFPSDRDRIRNYTAHMLLFHLYRIIAELS